MEILSFIIVDDSELDGFVAMKTIRLLGEKGSIITFANPHKALEHIGKQEPESQTLTVILLDIVMPIMSGFDFVAEFDKLPAHIRNSYYVVAITSSMNKKYTSRVNDYKTIKGVIEKPITTAKFKDLLSTVGQHAVDTIRL